MADLNPYASPEHPPETDRPRSPIHLRRPSDLPLWALGLALAAAYLVGAPISMRLSIRWPAPYWYAFALNGLAISLALGATLRQVVWGSVLGMFAGIGLWWAEIGAYHIFGLDWAYRGPWPVLLTIPAYACLVSVFLLTEGTRRLSLPQWAVALVVYFAGYSILVSVGRVACAFALPRCGTFMHGDYSVYGYRLGAFATCATFLGVAWLRQFVAKKNRRETASSNCG